MKNNNGYAKIIASVASNKESIIEYNIVPNEKTPWHYHTFFSETFEVLKGTLEVGRNGKVHQLTKGDIVTVEPKEKHYFKNISSEECLIKVTISPGNKHFENALLILKGLAKDGLASKAGIPKRFADLALFIYLNNSRMVGFEKIAEPLFTYVAKANIRNGHLTELINKYSN
jgi:quercetin dioxygenase-like cupin family protein